MTRPPPISPLFPTPPLSRSAGGRVHPPQVVHVATSEAAPAGIGDAEAPKHGNHAHAGHAMASAAPNSSEFPRSEEHTSELQSPCNLVCRLLLEKKNRTKVMYGVTKPNVHWLYNRRVERWLHVLSQNIS